MSKKKNYYNSSKNAIIGHTGYIGSFIKKKNKKISYFYNSKNIDKINHEFFNIVYLAAPSSLKYHANLFPKKDKNNVLKLIKNLKNLQCNKIIYFSSTDIPYSKKNKKNYYGKNRLEIENFIKKNFKSYLIIRLPSLFGGKLKKNFYFDILKNKSLKYYNFKTELQWYYLENIFKDINYLVNKKYKIVNLVSEPISCGEITKYLKINNLTFNKHQTIHKYNIKGNNKSSKKKYFYTKEQILKKMKLIYKKFHT